ncbi:hypothetical protein SEPCBS119000_006771 [Sporothrix epigloea]|uniref:Uncharacterized protein n=1 Tax=Sporothrix epigloea TaxID=1892477 RepID=A0ABP0E4W0_9PEZI
MPNPRLLRDTINGRGVMHVVGARLSAKGNAVLTCASAASRQYLQSTQHVWLPRLSSLGWKSVATKETWVRLIAHGVAVADMPQFSAEFHASNGVETRGAARWLKKPIGGKKHASVIFSIADQATADRLISSSVFFSAREIKGTSFEELVVVQHNLSRATGPVWALVQAQRRLGAEGGRGRSRKD